MTEDIKGFAYRKTPYRFVARYKDGKWHRGRLTHSSSILLNECACVLHYAQTCFEGLKAYRLDDGSIVCFRPDQNEKRLEQSCKRMVIPPLPAGMFTDAVRKVVKANADYVPSFESGGSLYVRPLIFGTDPVLGVKPATEFEFRIFVSPVGNYFAGGVKPLNLRISDYDRAAPVGTGHIKAGLNYAMSLYPIVEAHEQGYDENLYLDPLTRTYIEETGGANIIFISKDGSLVTPRSNTILPSITRRSIVEICRDRLGMNVEERKIALEELADMKECALCGTAAVVSPVGTITASDRTYTFNSVGEGSIISRISDVMSDIRCGKMDSPDGWLMKMI